ncbi:UNVERIFIED_CONTAM: hypothetical protein GTU68_062584 [Idotea baltica]|nr:hypothetical protein [Idotea baltica]
MKILKYLFVLIPITLLGHYLSWNSTLVFFLSAVSIIPLAGLLGEATENISIKLGPNIGGFLNATLGNAAELIIASIALKEGLITIVKASIIGSILGNLLLVWGLSCFLGGLKYKTMEFSVQGARNLTTMLVLSVTAMVISATHSFASPKNSFDNVNDLSLIIAVVLFFTYLASLLFSFKTHKQLFVASDHSEMIDHPKWSMRKSIFLLSLATIGIVLMSEILVHGIGGVAESLGMSDVFIGIIIVAIVGNAAEHSTAILVARKNKLNLSFIIAIGSSIQIALFVAPLLVFLSYFIAPEPMNLIFSIPEIISVILSVWIASIISVDGKINWFEGLQLLALYFLIGCLFYNLS